MAIKFPNLPGLFSALSDRFGSRDELPRYFRDHDGVLQKEFARRTPDDTTRRSFILTATDDGTIWEVTIDGTGALTTTKVLG